VKLQNILLTGATGAFGKYLLSQLVREGNQVTVIVRAKDNKAARDRLEGLIDSDPSINVLAGDLAKSNFGINSDGYAELQKTTTAILHAAASTRFNLTLKEARDCNVTTLEQILDFAEGVPSLDKFGYVSTAFVAGSRAELIKETDFNSGDTFINTYDQTKFEAEKLVRTTMDKLPISIYRPSLVVAEDSDDKHAAVVVLNLLKNNLLPIIPGSANDPVDLISADEASRAIVDLFCNHFSRGKTYHIASGKHAPTLGEIVAIVDSKPTYAGHSSVTYDEAVRKLIASRPNLQAIYQKIDSFIKYLCYPKVFDTSLCEETLKRDIGTDDVIGLLKKRLVSG
jgi:thioester reductase-like protein